MSKQEALDEYIEREFGEVQAMKLRELVEAALDEAAQAEYDAAIREMDEDLEVGTGAQKSLRERFAYLKAGGSWLKFGTYDTDLYLSGFEDAMKAVGVKP